MLEVLQRIVQEVNASPDLGKALNVIVSRVQRAISTDVCSVYLTDFETREHVLQATVGLSRGGRQGANSVLSGAGWAGL